MASYKGTFRPKNRSKYRGDPSAIVYRSSWELNMMMILDNNDQIEQWSSEEIVIPYRCRVSGKKRRYFVDFWVKKTNGDEMLIEIKPYAQATPPNIEKKFTPRTNKISRRYVQEVTTWGNNLSKWEAADEFCKDRGWKFKVLTEKGEVTNWRRFLSESYRK